MPTTPTNPRRARPRTGGARPAPVPADADQGAGQLHAAFRPLPPEVNIPRAADDDAYTPFEANDGDDALWQIDEEEAAGVCDDEETASWADSRGAYDDDLTSASLPEEAEVLSDAEKGEEEAVGEEEEEEEAQAVEAADPVAAFFSRRRQRVAKEVRGVYSGPQLIMDASDDEA